MKSSCSVPRLSPLVLPEPAVVDVPQRQGHRAAGEQPALAGSSWLLLQEVLAGQQRLISIVFTEVPLPLCFPNILCHWSPSRPHMTFHSPVSFSSSGTVSQTPGSWAHALPQSHDVSKEPGPPDGGCHGDPQLGALATSQPLHTPRTCMRTAGCRGI